MTVPPSARTARGRAAEDAAAAFLAGRGLTILERNARVGRGEIDIVARDGETIVFVEVRARRAGSRFDPAATIGVRKRRILWRAAERWLGEHGLGLALCRFDVLALVIDGDGWRVRHIEGAFVGGEGWG